jgi:GNAT superfamily N-acetyltransferase
VREDAPAIVEIVVARVAEEGTLGIAPASESARWVLRIGMAVAPESRRRGGRRMLIERLSEHGRAAGAHKLELEVCVGSAPPISSALGAPACASASSSDSSAATTAGSKWLPAQRRSSARATPAGIALR